MERSTIFNDKSTISMAMASIAIYVCLSGRVYVMQTYTIYPYQLIASEKDVLWIPDQLSHTK